MNNTEKQPWERFIDPYLQLNQILDVFVDAETTQSVFLDSRSKLGFVLHRCCSIDSLVTFRRIIEVMLLTPNSSTYSITLVASLCFCFQYIPLKDSDAISQWAYPTVRKHLISSDHEHIQALTHFLHVGGAKLLFSTDLVLEDICSSINDGLFIYGKSIGLIICSNPERLSEIFWCWFSKIEISLNSIVFLSDVVVNAPNLKKPSSNEETLKHILEICYSYSQSSNGFCYIEASLLVFKWMISVLYVTPKGIEPYYKFSSLNAIALSCWAEYVKYGDLSIFPEFQSNEDPIISRYYAQIMACVINNPMFRVGIIKIPYWVYNSICAEFDDNGYSHNYSIVSLSITELDYCIEVAHMLPAVFFVHAMRCRSKNVEFLSRMIRLVSFCPSSIISKYFEDFLKFLDFCFMFPFLSEDLALCIREQCVVLKPYQSSVFQHILSGFDFPKEATIHGRLKVVSSLILFSSDHQAFLDIFETILESLTFFKLSYAFLKDIFEFFVSMIKHIDGKNYEYIYLCGLATLSAVFLVQKPSIVSNNHAANHIYESSKSYYSYVSSDIVQDPNYSIINSFSIVPNALLLMKQMKPPNRESGSILFQILLHSLSVCPTETTALFMELLDYATSEDLLKYVESFCMLLKKMHQQKNSETFVLLTSVFQERVRKYMNFDISKLLKSNTIVIPQHIHQVRMMIQFIPDLMPLLLKYPLHLAILLENNAPTVSNVFISAVSSSINSNLSWVDQRRLRFYLKYYGFIQPEYIGNDWIRREFFDDFVCCLSFPEFEKSDSQIDLINKFSIWYPVIRNESEICFNIFKMYRKSVECYPIIKRIIQNDLNHFLESFCQSNWFIFLLAKLNIRYTIPSGIRLRSPELEVRLKVIPPPEPSGPIRDSLLYESLLACGVNDEPKRIALLEQSKSQFLALRFPPSNQPLMQTYLKALYHSEWISMKKLYFYHVTSFVDIRSNVIMFKWNEKMICELISQLDMSIPPLFNEILMFMASLVTQCSPHIKKNTVCDRFLGALSPYVAPFYPHLFQVLPILESIIQNAGISSKGAKKLIESLSKEWFDDVYYQNFKEIRTRILASNNNQ